MFQGKEIVVFFSDRIQLFSETEDNSVSGIQGQEIALSRRQEITMFQGKEIVFFFRDMIQLFSETEDNSVSGIQEQEIALFQRKEIDLFQIQNIAILRDRRQLGVRDSETGDSSFSVTVYSYFQRHTVAQFQGFRGLIQLCSGTGDTRRSVSGTRDSYFQRLKTIRFQGIRNRRQLCFKERRQIFFKYRTQLFSETEDSSVSGSQAQEIALFL